MGEVAPALATLRQAMLAALPADGAGIGNGRLRIVLAEAGHRVDDVAFDQVRADLIAAGLAAPGRGRGGSLRRIIPDAAAESAPPAPPAPAQPASAPSPVPLPPPS